MNDSCNKLVLVQQNWGNILCEYISVHEYFKIIVLCLLRTYRKNISWFLKCLRWVKWVLAKKKKKTNVKVKFKPVDVSRENFSLVLGNNHISMCPKFREVGKPVR